MAHYNRVRTLDLTAKQQRDLSRVSDVAPIVEALVGVRHAIGSWPFFMARNSWLCQTKLDVHRKGQRRIAFQRGMTDSARA